MQSLALVALHMSVTLCIMAGLGQRDCTRDTKENLWSLRLPTGFRTTLAAHDIKNGGMRKASFREKRRVFLSSPNLRSHVGASCREVSPCKHEPCIRKRLRFEVNAWKNVSIYYFIWRTAGRFSLAGYYSGSLGEIIFHLPGGMWR